MTYILLAGLVLAAIYVGEYLFLRRSQPSVRRGLYLVSQENHSAPVARVPSLPQARAPRVDPTVDRTGDVPPAWDCMKIGHVCVMGSAYCLECGILIG